MGGKTATGVPTAPMGNGGTARTRGDGEHKNGVCMWFVAGALQMISKRNKAPYKCNDPARRHASLKSVPLATMRKLLQDPEFMCCQSEAVKQELRQAVEEKKHLFGK